MGDLFPKRKTAKKTSSAARSQAHPTSRSAGAASHSAAVAGQPQTGAYPQTSPSSYPQAASYQQASAGSYPQAATAGYPQAATASYPQAATAGYPQAGATGYPQASSTGYSTTNAGYPQTATAGYSQTAPYQQASSGSYPQAMPMGYPQVSSPTHSQTSPSAHPQGSPSANAQASPTERPQARHTQKQKVPGIDSLASLAARFTKKGKPQQQTQTSAQKVADVFSRIPKTVTAAPRPFDENVSATFNPNAPYIPGAQNGVDQGAQAGFGSGFGTIPGPRAYEQASSGLASAKPTSLYDDAKVETVAEIQARMKETVGSRVTATQPVIMYNSAQKDGARKPIKRQYTAEGRHVNGDQKKKEKTEKRKTPTQRGQATISAEARDMVDKIHPVQRHIDPLPLVVVGAIAIAVGVFVYTTSVNPSTFEITVNGAQHTISRGSTLQTCIDYKYATPTAGDLLAVDNSVITTGGGYAFWASVNGEETTDGTTVLHKGDDVTIKDGEDIMEPYVTSTQTVPYTTRESSDYSGYAFHVFTEGKNGLNTYTTGTMSGISVVEETETMIPRGVKSYNATPPEDAKVISLTFDDGPWWKYTEEILDLLAEYNIKATFFVVGTQVEEMSYTGLLSRMISEGHEVLTHTYSHAAGDGGGVDMTLLSSAEQIEEITQGYEVIANETGVEPAHFFRAPGGNLYGSLITNASTVATAEIGWTIETNDWSSDTYYNDIVSALLLAGNGDVVHMHDGGGNHSATIAALKIALPIMVSKGYSFITISEMYQYVDLEDLSTEEAEEAAE